MESKMLDEISEILSIIHIQVDRLPLLLWQKENITDNIKDKLFSYIDINKDISKEQE